MSGGHRCAAGAKSGIKYFMVIEFPYLKYVVRFAERKYFYIRGIKIDKSGFSSI